MLSPESEVVEVSFLGSGFSNTSPGRFSQDGGVVHGHARLGGCLQVEGSVFRFCGDLLTGLSSDFLIRFRPVRDPVDERNPSLFDGIIL